jgi:hypothetical protein
MSDEPAREAEAIRAKLFDKCPRCGNTEVFHVENHSLSRDPLFSDLHCSRCGALVRHWNSV